MKSADKFNRSASTNDPTKLDDVDRRSRTGRRMRDLIASLTAELGSPLNDAEAAWIKLAAGNMLLAEQISAEIARGEQVNKSDVVRLTNSANRTMKELRSLKAARPDAKNGLSPLQRLLSDLAEDDQSEEQAP
jgi:hypothetical protein